MLYKGRISFMELMTMRPSWFQVLYKIAFDKIESKQAEKELQTDVLEEAFEEGGVM